MKPLIINVRGTSGSGKTHLTREFMRSFKHVGRVDGAKGKVLGYTLRPNAQGHAAGESWHVIGSYENVCGGCDTIKTQQEIIDRVSTALDYGHNVWLEGLILSTIYGLVGAYSEDFKERWVFTYLDTPVDVCVERVIERRRIAGNIKPFDKENTVKRHATILRNRAIVEEKGRRTGVLRYQQPLKDVRQLIKELK